MPITKSKPSSRKKSGGLPASRSSSHGSHPGRRTSAAKRSAPPPSLFGNISPERKIDILGVILALVGFLTLLSLFSAQNATLTGYWIQGLKSVVGWGVYILPAALIVIGAWLVARNIERLPALNVERIVGIVMLFIGLLVTFHGLSGPAETAIERAQAGTGGGHIGGLLQQWLVGGIGNAGTVILVLAWLIIAVAMTLDLSLQEMFQWAGPILEKLKARLNRPVKVRPGGEAMNPTGARPPSQMSTGEFTPLHRPAIVENPVNTQVPPGVTVKDQRPFQTADRVGAAARQRHPRAGAGVIG